MDFLRFLCCLERHGPRPHEVASESRRPEFPQRPGMHQTIEDPDRIPFTFADRELLGQMGICAAISEGNQWSDFKIPESDNAGHTVVAGVSTHLGFPGGNGPI